ncbi:MFS transporter [soil metagenome]
MARAPADAAPALPVDGLRLGFLLPIGIASFASSAALRLCDAMLPALASEFGVGLGRAALATSGYALAYGLLQLVYGALGDRFGKWRVVSLATLACTLGNLLAAVSGSLDMLIAARVLSGATAAAIIPLSMALIGDAVPFAQRQVVLARFLTATISGMIVGQWLSGLFADTLGWRWAFSVFALLFAIVGAAMVLRPPAGMRMRAAAAPGSASGPGLLAGMRQVLRDPWVRWLLAVTIVQAALAFAAVTFIPAFLHHEFGLGLQASAGVVVAYGVGGLVYAWRAAALLRMATQPTLVAIGGAMVALSYAVMAFAGHWLVALPACVVAGMGYYMLQNMLNTQASQMAPALRGTAMSLFAASLFSGIFVGVSVGAAVVDLGGYRGLFGVVSAGIAIMCLVMRRGLLRRSAGLS